MKRPSWSERNRERDLIKVLEKTKYGKDGMGGLKVNGLMYAGYPRWRQYIKPNSWLSLIMVEEF
jgi:hypothetical protein